VAQLQVELVAVEEKVWSGSADMVVARTYDVSGGFLSVTGKGVTILAESCQPATEKR
jgi:F-type H+-transporting ATPase subunit epsilon